MRYAIAMGLVAAAASAGSRARAGDHCHAPPTLEAKGRGVRIGSSAEAAGYRNSSYEGSYQGLAVTATYSGSRVRLRSVLPAYRLTRNGLVSEGLGDLLTEGLISVVPTDMHPFSGGAVASLISPTAGTGTDLGMGHFMAIAGLWAERRTERVLVWGRVGYARALAAAGQAHAQHGGTTPGPIVSPMNASEFTGSLAAGYRLHEMFQMRGGLYGAVPAGIGSARAIALAGADLVFSTLDLGVEGHVPFVGEPFTVKVVLMAGARF